MGIDILGNDILAPTLGNYNRGLYGVHLCEIIIWTTGSGGYAV